MGTSPQDDCPVVELRQYTLHPGQGDRLVELFDREFVETQEACGLAVMGQFRDLDNADRFVWLRGFAGMAERQAGLAAFYGGPVWRAHGDAANATMAEWHDVLLLRPAWPGSGIPVRGRARPTTGDAPGRVDARVFHLKQPATDALFRLCRERLAPVYENGGAQVLGWYATEDAPNNFPRLPVREGEHVLAVFALFADPAAAAAFDQKESWRADAEPLLEPWLARPTQHLRLAPTGRSAIHAGATAGESP